MSQSRIGLVGLAVMGANLALNIAEKGFKVAVYNRTTARTDEFVKEAAAERLDGNVTACATVKALVAALVSRARSSSWCKPARRSMR